MGWRLGSTYALEHRCHDLTFMSLNVCVEDKLRVTETPAFLQNVCVRDEDMGHTEALVLFIGGIASDRRAPAGPMLWLCIEDLQDAPRVGTPQPALPLPAAENLPLAPPSSRCEVGQPARFLVVLLNMLERSYSDQDFLCRYQGSCLAWFGLGWPAAHHCMVHICQESSLRGLGASWLVTSNGFPPLFPLCKE